jgi:dihydroorotate dehydrogenase (NAD+) catalytic subunit
MMGARGMDVSCSIAGVKLKNPIVLASGIWGTSPALLLRAARCGAGAVTAKTCTPVARRGHKNPAAVDWGHGLLNAMGLPNPGAEEETELLREAKLLLASQGVKLIASISADTAEDFGRAAVLIARAEPDLIELNISCPNIQDCDHGIFAGHPQSAAAVTRAVKSALNSAAKIPCIVKLAPNVPSISEIALAVAEAGADAITAINTMPGMLIDAESGRPVLANTTGGVSGPALKPIALRCVYETREAVRVPIIGTGGIVTGIDAVEMIAAGATAVGVGSAVTYRGEKAFALILSELEGWLSAHGYSRLEDIRGIAHAKADAVVTTNPPPVPGWERG